jgi:phage tail-like protein
VSWGDSGDAAAFSEVSGLASHLEPIDFREGDEPTTVRRVAGARKSGNVVLKRGIVPRGDRFWDWWEGAQSGRVERRPVVVTLLDEAGDALVRWEISGAWPVKLDGPSPDAEGDEIAVESIELAYERIKIAD